MIATLLSKKDREYAIGLSRAFAGAVLFSLPLLMTMEMWRLGFYLDPARFLLFLALNFAVLTGLSRLAGFEPTNSLAEDVGDALAAFAVGVITSAAILMLLGVITPGMPISEVVGKVAIQAVPASFGAMVSTKQMGIRPQPEKEEQKRRDSYFAQLFLMVAGALFLAFNLAPTEEMILIAFQMTPWHGLTLIALSIVLLHAFVYTVGFSGQEKPPGGSGFFQTFFHFSIVGYGIAVAISLYVLWTFGRTDGADVHQIALMTAVLAFPAAIGAAIARLVV